jgi:SSS family solute:Na+ symporter
LIAGTLAATLHHGLTIPAGALSLIKGGWMGEILYRYPSEMAQNFWTAIFAWVACFLVTIWVSLGTRRHQTDEELRGLVYSLTPRLKDGTTPWYLEPAPIGAVILAAGMGFYILFW